MKEKIEEILEAYTNYGFGENLDNVIEMEFKMKTPTGKVGEYIGYPSLVNELTTLIQEERKKAVEEKEKWLGFYRSDILSGFIPKCSCGKKADVQTERGKYAQENLHRPSNWGWYCNKCFEKGLREEEEAMGYYDKEYLESEGKE